MFLLWKRDLTGLWFFQMSILVEQQDEQVKNIESTALTVEKDTEAG